MNAGLRSTSGILIGLALSCAVLEIAGAQTAARPMFPIAMPPPTPEEREVLRIVSELRSPGPPHADDARDARSTTECQAAKLTQVAEEAARALRCHGIDTHGEPPCDRATPDALRAVFENAERERTCSTMHDADDVAFMIERLAGSLGTVIDTHAQKGCERRLLDAAGSTVGRILASHAAARRARSVVREPSDWCYELGHAPSDHSCRIDGQRVMPVCASISQFVDDVVVALWPLSDLPITFAIPNGWQIDARDLSRDTIEMDTFHHACAHGGILPDGGASISISSSERPADVLLAAYHDCIDCGQPEYVRVAGDPAERFTTTRSYGERWEKVYVAHRDRMYVLWLADWDRDPHHPDHLATFEALLAGMRLR